MPFCALDAQMRRKSLCYLEGCGGSCSYQLIVCQMLPNLYCILEWYACLCDTWFCTF